MSESLGKENLLEEEILDAGLKENKSENSKEITK